MATVTGAVGFHDRKPDLLSGTPRANAIDRWIFVFMAAWFIAIVLAGFIPDSLMKVEMVRTGQRPPFPMVLHMHAVVMGAFLLLLFAQTWLMATGRKAMHMQLGIGSVLTNSPNLSRKLRLWALSLSSLGCGLLTFANGLAGPSFGMTSPLAVTI